MDRDARVEQVHQETGERMLAFFKADHLPEKLRPTSQLFGVMAVELVERLPKNAERTVALRKLLEAKDCAVRAILEG